MSDASLSALIREVLAEELARLKPAGHPFAPAPEVERVSIASSADLNAFARKLIAMSRDDNAVNRINSGKLVFELAGTKPASAQAAPPAQAVAAGAVHTIERGFVSERQIDRLPKEVTRLVLGKPVRITPLARDRARQRGMIIERMNS